MSSLTNHYETLGVAKHVDQRVIKKAFQRLAMKWHPDRVQADRKAQAEERFKEIRAAYEVLSDPVKRALYDQELNASQRQTDDARWRDSQERQKREERSQKAYQENSQQGYQQQAYQQPPNFSHSTSSALQLIGLGMCIAFSIVLAVWGYFQANPYTYFLYSALLTGLYLSYVISLDTRKWQRFSLFMSGSIIFCTTIFLVNCLIYWSAEWWLSIPAAERWDFYQTSKEFVVDSLIDGLDWMKNKLEELD